MTVDLMNKILTKTNFSISQRSKVMNYLRKRLYAGTIDQLIYDRIKAHVCNNTNKEVTK